MPFLRTFCFLGASQSEFVGLPLKSARLLSGRFLPDFSLEQGQNSRKNSKFVVWTTFRDEMQWSC